MEEVQEKNETLNTQLNAAKNAIFSQAEVNEDLVVSHLEKDMMHSNVYAMQQARASMLLHSSVMNPLVVNPVMNPVMNPYVNPLVNSVVNPLVNPMVNSMTASMAMSGVHPAML